MRPNKNLLSLSPAWLGGIFAVLMIGFAGIAGIQNHSPIIYWDMWDGTLNMILRVRDGDTTVWWAQHNEHRIILSRALFWIDYAFFDGMSYFLVFMNYVLCAFTAGTLYFFMRKTGGRDREWTSRTWALLFFLVGTLFLATQIDNFASGFQSQFFFAQLLPLGALYFLARSATSAAWTDFWLASLLGILAAGSMANGVVVAPLMLVYALVLRQGLARTVILGIISAAVLFLYFNGYVTPGGHGSLGPTVLQHPVGVFNYTMMFLGSPFNFLVGGGRLGKLVALAAGIAFTIMSLGLLRRWFFTVEKSPFAAALLSFIAYIAASGLAIAGGRLILGEASVFSHRYTTPAIMAWVALLLLLWHREGDRPVTNSRGYLFVLAGAGAMMLVYQVKALGNASESLFPREVAALALSLDINDEAAIKNVYPSAEHALKRSQTAKPLGLSFFGQPPYAGLWQEMGAPLALPDGPACLGALEAATPVAGAPAYIRVTGWLFDPQTRTAPRIVRFISDQGLVDGIAVVGKKRSDVGKMVGRRGEYAGFVGYMRAGSAGATVIASGGGAGCRISFPVPPLG